MTTDRELLELAAKACGFGGPEHQFCWTESEYPRGSGQHGALWNYIGHMDTAVLWNPLTDDGDALRLAVKVKQLPSLLHDESGVSNGYYAARRSWNPIVEKFGDDPVAAMRRAIVRAAAEIGRAAQAESHNTGGKE